MSTPAMVPVFSPDGQLGDIPAERVNEARKAGFSVGVHMQSADGQSGIIPASRTADAVKAGMKIVPIQDQPAKSWLQSAMSSLGSDLGGMVSGAGQIPQMALGGTPFPMMPMAGNMAINDMQRSMEGRSTPYRAIAPVGEAVGVNVRGMEESANQGDVGGVLGHAAAVPTAMAAGELLGRAPLGRVAKAGGSALKAGAENFPIVGKPTKAAIVAALKSWRGSAPVPEVNPAAVSPSRTLPGMNPPEVIRPPAQPIPQRSGLMLPGDIEKLIPASKVSTTPPKPTPVAQSKSSMLSQLRQIAQRPGTGVSAPETTGPSLNIEGKPVPANTNLAPALQKSLPAQARLEGKVMQVIREQGKGLSMGKETLMDSPKLRGEDPSLVEKAVVSLANQGKIWHEQTGGGAHPASYTVALKAKR